jgi:hypothetical protein
MISMYPSDDPLNNLSPEQRRRVEAALQGLGAGTFEGITPAFAAQFTGQQSNQAWAHWEYSAEEWALFEKVDWALRGFAFWVFFLGTIVSLLAALPFILAPIPGSSGLFPEQVASLSGALFGIALPLFIVLLIITLTYHATYGEAKKRRKARRNKDQLRRVTISRKGVWEAGTYFPFNDDAFRMYLREVKMTPEPPVLHFRYALGRSQITTSDDGTTSVASPQTTTMRVLVPRGREAEAEQLMQRFRTQVIGVPKKVSPPPEPHL